MRTNKQDLFSIKRQEQDSSVKMDAVLVFLLTIFLKARKKGNSIRKSPKICFFFSLILRTRIKDGYHVPKIDKFVEEIVPRMNEIEFQKHFRLSRDTYNILLTE